MEDGALDLVQQQLLADVRGALRSVKEARAAVDRAKAIADAEVARYKDAQRLAGQFAQALEKAGVTATEFLSECSALKREFSGIVEKRTARAHAPQELIESPPIRESGAANANADLVLPEGDKRRQLVLLVVGAPDRSWSTKDLVAQTGFFPPTVRSALGWACKHGYVLRLSPGRYKATSAGVEAASRM